MNTYRQHLLAMLLALAALTTTAQPYDFQNLKLKDEKRVDLFLKHLTLEEKLDWLTTRTSTPRLGMPMLSCYEGLHGLALGGPAHNNGRRTENGKEVVQLYASYPESEVEHPRRQLRAFQRVSIRKGEACNISLEVDKRDLSYWDEEAHAFVQVKGPVRFEIGASSADIRQTVTYGL
jgi:hypothetical protein